MSYVAARTEGTGNGTLVFTFHGTGGNEHQFHDLASQLLPGAAVVSPRGDVRDAGMNRYFRRTGEGIYDMDDLWARTNALAAFLAEERSKADALRVVGLGYSNGANILAAIAMSHPEIVDEIVLMHPLIPWTPQPQPGLADKRVLITAGRRDPICPAPMTEALADYLRQQGTSLTLHWHEGGHELRPEELGAMQAFLG
jgi:phospholipase/carboxylesterase